MVRPQGVRANSWQDVADLSDAFGIRLDAWQELILEASMGERSDRTWAAKRVGVTVPRQNGKALDATTPILTADRGFIQIGDLVVGDQVMHPAGHAVTVIAVSEVMYDRPCYRVTTVDGRSIVADRDHLWTVTDKRRERSVGPAKGPRTRWFEERTLTTGEMLAEGLSRYNSGGRTTVCDGKRYEVNEYRFKLPDVSPAETNQRDLPLDPYLLGAWLGDGTSISASLTCSLEDVDHWASSIVSSGFVPSVKFPADRAARIGITCSPGPGRQSRSFGGALRRLGLLGNKHVPEDYLTSSISQRLALLQGLMDTGGSIGRSGQAEFVSTETRLAEAVLFLVRSLGWRATIREFRTKIDGRDCGPGWRVHFTPKLCDGMNPFRMARKASRVSAKDGGAGRTTVSIASVEPVESRPVRCIQVASPDGLFLAGRDLVPTHNSQLLVARALAGALLFGEKKIVVSAHQQDTARESFAKLMEIVEDDANESLRARVKGVMNALNRESVKFTNGATIQFKARSGAAGKGFSSDCLLLDEAQILGSRAWTSINSTMSAMRNPQVWLLGTPPQDEDDCYAFEMVRRAALGGKSSAAAWCEWSADVNGDEYRDARADLAERRWSPAVEYLCWSANPAWLTRINLEVVRGEFETYSPDRFAQDRLGIWRDESAASARVIHADEWAATGIEPDDVPTEGVRSLGVKFSPDGSRVSVAGSMKHADGIHVELVGAHSGSMSAGTASLVAWVAERWNKYAAIVVDGKSHAGAFVNALIEAGVSKRVIVTPSWPEVATANGMLLDAVVLKQVTHLASEGQKQLDDSVLGTTKKIQAGASGGGAWSWEPIGEADATPIAAAALAHWGSKTSKRVPGRKQTVSY